MTKDATGGSDPTIRSLEGSFCCHTTKHKPKAKGNKEQKATRIQANDNCKMSIESVPTVDISPLLNQQHSADSPPTNDDATKKCIEEISFACREWGFFYIQNHPIEAETISSFRSTMEKFFKHTPPESLNSIRRTSNNSRGYYDDELTKGKLDWKRGFDFGAQDGSLDNRGMDGYNQWPSSKRDDDNNNANFETIMRDYFHQMENLSKILLGAICSGLGMKSDALKQHFDTNHTSYLRLNYYPVCPDPSNHLAIHHHTDAGALTILYQDDDISSLQVYKDDAWHYVPPRKDTFVINIGDMIQVWSNREYIAPLHRVQANEGKERFSAPFFYNPSYETDVEPLRVVGLVGDNYSSLGGGPKYKTINWGKFRAQRFAGDFADLGEEIQISHFLKDTDEEA